MDGVKRYTMWQDGSCSGPQDTGDWVTSEDFDASLAREAALREELATQDRVLRSSVPEPHKACTSPVGAVQSYIAELEQRNAELVELLRSVCADSRLWYQEFGEPSSGEYTAAFVDAEAALKPTESGASTHSFKN